MAPVSAKSHLLTPPNTPRSGSSKLDSGGEIELFPPFKDRTFMNKEDFHINTLQVGDHDEVCKDLNCEARKAGYKIPSIFPEDAPMTSAGGKKENPDGEIMEEVESEGKEDGGYEADDEEYENEALLKNEK